MNDNNFEIPLELNEKLKNKNIVQKFVKNTKHHYLKIELNHKYEKTNVIVSTVNIKNWSKFHESLKKMLNLKGVYDQEDIRLILNTVDDNHEKILGFDDDNNNSNNEEEQQHQQMQQQESVIEIPFSEWSIKLVEKYSDLQREILNLIPELWEPVEFALSVRSILRIKNITLPFAGIVLGPSSSLKSATVELFRNTKDTYYSDSFSAKSFVSHNTAIPKEKLVEIDLLPKIKDKLFLTPELSPTFSKKEEELNEILGIITRVLDGHGYESDSGAQGHRGYNGEYKFMWIGAAVDVPRKVHKLLGTLGPKLYFFRIKTKKKNEKYYLRQQQEEKDKGDYSQKIEKIKSKMNDYLKWFDSKPLDYNIIINNNNDIVDEDVLLRIIRLAILLRHLRANVPVWETKDSQGSDYAYTSVSFEEPDRAITQLKNLARGHALSQGRSKITMKDIPVLIKVVLSTASKERVILFDHLLENDGQLDTLSIKEHLMISKNTALKTMAEFVFLEIVDRLEMQNNDPNNRKAFQIQLKDEFYWFLSDEFRKLRENFGKEYYDEYVSSKQQEQEQKTEETEKEEEV